MMMRPANTAEKIAFKVGMHYSMQNTQWWWSAYAIIELKELFDQPKQEVQQALDALW